MILYPAIDIRGGHAVRLVEGDYDRETVFDADPVDAALRFADAGVHVLHVVDLDGAKAGEPVNLETVRRIADAVPFPIQVGGGLRDAECVANVLRAGAEHVVIGTAAMRDPEFLDAMLKEHGGADRRLGRRARRQGLAGGLDRDLRRRGGRRGRRPDRARGAALPLHADRGRRDAGRAGLRAARRGGGGDLGLGHLLGRRRDPRRPRTPARRVGAERRRRDRRPRALREAASPSKRRSPR